MYRRVSMISQPVRTRTSKSSLPILSVDTIRDVLQPALMSTGYSGDVLERAAAISQSETRSRSSGADASSSQSDGGIISISVSEAPWSGLPALKPLVNPLRLQTLRLVSRDNETCLSPQVSNQPTARHGCQSSSPEVIDDDEEVPSVTFPASNWRKTTKNLIESQQVQFENLQQQQTDQISHQMDSETSFQTDSLSCSPVSPLAIDRNQRNSQRRIDCVDDATYDNRTNRSGSETVYDEGRATLASSRCLASSMNSIPRNSVFQYSFRVPETRANMRAFCHASDRRIEAIARACDSEITLDPQPIRLATTPVTMRRITIRAPDLRSLEKCCRMFDDTFPKFYASSGLGPGGRGVSEVCIDDKEPSKPASRDNLAAAAFANPDS